MKILPLHVEITRYLAARNLQKKFSKQIKFLFSNPHHPSLHTELLIPKQHGIYSFRIDHKYRALFIFRPDQKAIEILTITDHYQ